MSETSTRSPTEVMDEVWAAFGRKDLDAVVACFAEDGIIKVEGADHVPFVGTFTGRQAQREFFNLGGAEAQRFEVKQYVAQGEDVITLGEFDWLVTSTGRHYAGDWALHTRIVDGRIVLWQMYENSWSVGQAFGV